MKRKQGERAVNTINGVKPITSSGTDGDFRVAAGSLIKGRTVHAVFSFGFPS
jgi:hypothetical protein